MPRLRVIQTLSAGVDWLLPRAPKGVTVCRAVGVHDSPVSEWVVAVILALGHRIPQFVDAQSEGRWAREPGDEIDDLDGKTVLIVGHGSIGRMLASRLEPFGVRVVGVARHSRAGVQPASALPELLPGADVVVDLLPYSKDTERFVDATFLARMKPGALFVNAGRGKTVDTAALVDALTAGRIRAALDVTDPEPLPDGHPLWHAPNVLITPHVAGSSLRFPARAYRFAGEQVRRYAAGEPLLGVESPQ